MIVQPQGDGTLIMIAQSDHSRSSGVLAAHWGNETFARPRPYESAVRAAMLHDCGWYRYETSPRFDEKTHTTPTFFQVALDAEQLNAFQWGTDWLTEIDPYAGLLINRHRTGLWRGRYGAITHPPGFNAPPQPGGLEDFIKRNEARQEQEMKAVDQKEFAVNYRLIQVWDLLSLYFCIGKPKEDHIEPVPTSYDSDATVRLTLTPRDERRVTLDPFPFDVPSMPVQIVHRRLPKSTFADKAEFRQAYYQASPELLSFEFVRK